MTTTTFRYIDPSSYDPRATEPFKRPWNKVDGPGFSYKLLPCPRNVQDIRGRESEFTTDNSGFAVYEAPSQETHFTNEEQIRTNYYNEIEDILRKTHDGIKKVVIFDHTIRRNIPGAARNPVQLVHIDQTPFAAELRVRRHLPEHEVQELLGGRYQIINVWRPIEHPASDFPLGVLDWRSTKPEDFVKVDLLYPKDADKRGEVAPDPESLDSAEGYEPRGEQYAIAPNDAHQFYYLRDMRPDEVMMIKCFDSRSHLVTGGETNIAHGSGHSAFIDPLTPADAPPRQSIEVRCLVFYD